MTTSHTPPADAAVLTALLQERAQPGGGVATCSCGVTHFVLAALSEADQRSFLARAEQSEQRFRSVAGPIRLCQVGALRYVLDCPCGWDDRLARLLWSERDLIVSFLTAKSAALTAIATATTQQLDELRRVASTVP